MSTGDNHTINVSIVAYRDADLASTLLSLFRASASPGKLVVGVIWQGDEGDAAIAPGSECFSEIANLAPPSRGTDENHGQPYDFTGPGGARYDYELKANGHVLWLTMPSAEAKGACAFAVAAILSGRTSPRPSPFISSTRRPPLRSPPLRASAARLHRADLAVPHEPVHCRARDPCGRHAPALCG